MALFCLLFIYITKMCITVKPGSDAHGLWQKNINLKIGPELPQVDLGSFTTKNWDNLMRTPMVNLMKNAYWPVHQIRVLRYYIY